MTAETGRAIRDLVAIQCKATATLQLQLAGALTSKPEQELLREHFVISAGVLMRAAKELERHD